MNTKYLNFSIFFIILSFFDIVSTQYALTTYPSMHEGNVIMALVTDSFLLFVVIKVCVVSIILKLYQRMPSTICQHAQQYGKYILLVGMILVVSNNLLQIVTASDNVFINPTCMKPSFDADHNEFLLTNHNATTGSIVTSITSLGFFSYNYRVTDGIQLTCAVQDISTTAMLPTQYRIFGVSHLGYVFYTDNTIINYTNTPFSTQLNPTTLIKIGDITPWAHGNEQITTDSIGNVYAVDGDNILRYVKTSNYAQSIFHILVSGIDYYMGSCVGCGSPQYFHYISDMNFDPSGNMNLLVATEITNGGNGVLITSLSRLVLDENGNKISMTVLKNITQVNNPDKKIEGKILVDSTNYSTNFIYAYWTTDGGVWLKHVNSSAEVDLFGGVLTGISSLGGIGYMNQTIYVASTTQNLIRNYLTSYISYVPSPQLTTTEPAQIIYNIKTISSDYSNYYNTSSIYITAKIDADSGYNLLGANYLVNLAKYRWRIDLVDPNSVVVSSVSTSPCIDSWAPLNPTGRCILTTKYKYTAPSVGWMPGTWRLNLYETGLESHLAYLSTNTYNIYNASISANGSTVSSPEEPITSDQNQAAITLLDGYVGLLGFGISGVTKFGFSLLVVVMFFVIGMWKGSGNIGLALSTIPYTFFTYISYIPKWVFIIYIIMLIMIAKVFR